MKRKFGFLGALLATLFAGWGHSSASAAGIHDGFKLADYADIVTYQVNPRVFAPTGSLNAVTSRLDSIKALGINTIWIMPIYPIGIEKTKNSPYCIRDYTAVAPEFGTLDDYKHLVAECHKRGIAVIQDFVANHTAWDHPWVKKHPKWYTHNKKGEIISPQGPGWDWDDVADLNYDNRQMRKAMTAAMKFWITEVGLDGFRCDVADGVPADFWHDCILELRKAAQPRRIVMLAEGKKPENFTIGGFDMDYGWDFKANLVQVFTKGKSAASIFTTDSAEYAIVPQGKIKMRFTTNHDQSTEATPPVEFGSLRASMAAYVATVMLHGGALVYGSQEVGYPEPINFFHYVPVDWTHQPLIYREYERMLAVYNAYPSLRKGQLTAHPDRDILLFEKSGADGRYLVAVNVRNAVHTIALPWQWQGAEVTNVMTAASEKLPARLELQPYDYVIVKR